MIARQVIVTTDWSVDEQTCVGRCANGEYAQFGAVAEGEYDPNAVPAAMLPAAVMDAYVAAQVRIPDEFTEVREAVQTKINALQAVL